MHRMCKLSTPRWLNRTTRPMSNRGVVSKWLLTRPFCLRSMACRHRCRPADPYSTKNMWVRPIRRSFIKGPPLAGLQQYVEQAVRNAYYQGVAHASDNISSATQLTGGGGRGICPVMPQGSYRHDAFRGGVVGREGVTLGGKGVGPVWDERYNSFPHSVVLRENYADGGFKYLWKGAPPSGPKRRQSSSMNRRGTTKRILKILTTSLCVR